jgi:hypothetical protein
LWRPISATAWVNDKMAELTAAGRPDDESPAVDSNERVPGTCYFGDAQVVNMSPVDLARLVRHKFAEIGQW